MSVERWGDGAPSTIVERLGWAVHNVVAHPLLVVCPPIGAWIHDLTAPPTVVEVDATDGIDALIALETVRDLCVEYGDGVSPECSGMADRILAALPAPSGVLWWVTVTDANDVLVYDGPAPCPPHLVELSVDDAEAGRLYTFDMQPMGDRP